LHLQLVENGPVLKGEFSSHAGIVSGLVADRGQLGNSRPAFRSVRRAITPKKASSVDHTEVGSMPQFNVTDAI
jgi:hypothetical protein